MQSDEPITEWIDQLKTGDEVAAQKLWERYFSELVKAARTRLLTAKRTAADEEDVAISTFNSLCVGAEEGKFPRLSDRESLWSLLMAIVAHKSTDLIRYENRKKRGGAGVSPTDLEAAHSAREMVGLSDIIEKRPTPEFAALISAQFEALIQKLRQADDPDLMQIAIAKMLGNTNVEVARQLGCVRRTVERKILVIRRIWEKEIAIE